MITGFWMRLIAIIWMKYGTWRGVHKTVDGGAATSVFAAFEPSLNGKLQVVAAHMNIY